MTTQEVLDNVRGRTHHPSETSVLVELKEAVEWVARRVYNSENGPDFISTFGEEITLSVYTREQEMVGTLAATPLGFKRVWLMLPGDAIFTPMIAADTSDGRFSELDSEPASSTVTAQSHPVYFDVINFTKLRFAPALPTGAILRVDYYGYATVSGTLSAQLPLPPDFHSVIQTKTTALAYDLLDDSRAAAWEGKAESALNDALYQANRRVQGPTRTTPFVSGRRRII